jgi:hypothetical protein
MINKKDQDPEVQKALQELYKKIGEKKADLLIDIANKYGVEYVKLFIALSINYSPDRLKISIENINHYIKNPDIGFIEYLRQIKEPIDKENIKFFQDLFKLIRIGKKAESIFIPKDPALDKIEVEKKEESKGSYKKSAHLVDQILKYDYPKDKKKNRQPELFDIWEENKKEIERISETGEILDRETGNKIEALNNLSAPELKIIDCLCLLLHKKSQISDPKKADYFTGDKGYEIEAYNFKSGNKLIQSSTPAPNLSITYFELAKIYNSRDQIGGRDIEDIRLSLQDLSEKKFFISYFEKVKNSKGEYSMIEIQTVRPIIYVDKAILSKGINNIEESKKTSFIITLHPIFRRQIDSKFISYPEDINKRTLIAYGNSNISDITIKLREDLMRALSDKHYDYEIYQDRLYWKVGEKYMRQSRKSLVKKFLNKAIETIKKLGLLESYDIITGETGEPKYLFKLNKNF